MQRSYRHISIYGKEILEMLEKRMTRQGIADKFGFTKKQIKNFITRYNNNQKKLAAGIVIHKRGRP